MTSTRWTKGLGLAVAQLGRHNQQPLYLASVICFLLGWLVLGVQAIRLDRPATTPRPA